MSRLRWDDYVVSDPAIQDGEPCFRGTHIPIRTVLAAMAEGSSIQTVLKTYPDLSVDKVFAIFALAADRLQDRVLQGLQRRRS